MVFQKSGQWKPRWQQSSSSRAIPDDEGESSGPGGGDPKSEQRLQESRDSDAIDLKYGYERVADGVGGGGAEPLVGFLLNMRSKELLDDEKRLVSAVDLYFIREDGSRFKVPVPFRPYFYVLVRSGSKSDGKEGGEAPSVSEGTVAGAYIVKKYAQYIDQVEEATKEDLDLPNHLAGIKQTYLKLYFLNTANLTRVRRDILAAVRRNRERTTSAYSDLLAKSASISSMMSNGSSSETASLGRSDPTEGILDIREHDLPLHVRVSIDLGVSVY